VYRVKPEDEASKTRQRRLRRRREKRNKKKSEPGGGGATGDAAPATGSTKKRGLLDDPESSDDDDRQNPGQARAEDRIDPEQVKASDELEYLATVIASHKVRSFVFVAAGGGSGPVRSAAPPRPRSAVVRVVCALATNAVEAHDLVRSKEYVAAESFDSRRFPAHVFVAHSRQPASPRESTRLEKAARRRSTSQGMW
jgi:hypothetical protein